jgi:serine/threonine protein kinase/tetratricopeptide (TPR) repeat protein
VSTTCPKCHSENSQTKQFCGDCGTPLPSSKDIHPVVTGTLQTPINELTTGSIFAGRYQVIEELGKGGMGRVYKVFDTKIKEKVALKLIKPEIASDKETIERFGNELRLARKISQRNVCRMFDMGEAEGAHFITMEYVHGEDLKSMIHMSGSLSVGMLLSVGKQVCDGLAEAHSLGVVHRDLKPQNIMIDKNGNAKIMDFGIARSVKDKGLTGAGVMIGTPQYMSPEQAEAKEIDHRSDIYSLGVILYEMATSRVPFEGETALSIAMKHKGEIPKDPKQLNPHIPDDLNEVILKCLEKDKAKRYQNASDISSVLEKIEKGIPTTERVVPEQKTITSREITVKFSLKKLMAPVLIVAVIVLAAAAYWLFIPKEHAPSTPVQKNSIAVLPFVDLSPQKDHEWLSDGISEAMINALSRLKNLRVAARTSAYFFKEKKSDIHEIGRMLKVENVLEGSVQVAGNMLRITAQLISVKDGYQLWSDKFDRKSEDVFAIQDEIAREIVKALKVRLLGEDEVQLGKRHTENIEAYNLYLQGLYFWNKRTEEDLKKSVEFFKKAIERDPEYALAYVGLADSYIILGAWAFLSPDESFPEAKKAALKALEIDPSLGETHNALAYISFGYGWDWAGAEREFKRALEVSPNNSIVYLYYFDYLLSMGKFDEALIDIRRAQELDPLSLIINAVAGKAYQYAGKYDKAIEQYKKTLEMDSNFRPAHSYLGEFYLKRGMHIEALSEYKLTNDVGRVGLTYALMGKTAEARQLVNELTEQSKHMYVPKSKLAGIYFGLGDNNKGFAWLEQAVEERDFLLIWIKVSPYYNSVRGEPRFKALLKKMNLKQP